MPVGQKNDASRAKMLLPWVGRRKKCRLQPDYRLVGQKNDTTVGQKNDTSRGKMFWIWAGRRKKCRHQKEKRKIPILYFSATVVQACDYNISWIPQEKKKKLKQTQHQF